MEDAKKIIEEVKKAVVGKDEILEKVLMAILAQGHVLLEDVPGVGKTTMALAFSRAMELSYKRLQFIIRVQSCAICFWQMKSTGPPAKRSLRCWRSWKKARSPLTVLHIRCLSPFWSLPRKTRSAHREHSPCRNLRSTVLWFAFHWGTRTGKARLKCCAAEKRMSLPNRSIR